MKKLSDYQGEEAIELWADLLDPLSDIITDEEFKNVVSSGKAKIEIAKTILKNNKKAAMDILLRIDPEPINGLNIVLRLVSLITEIGSSDMIKSFFGYADQGKTEKEPSGLPTGNTEEKEN